MLNFSFEISEFIMKHSQFENSFKKFRIHLKIPNSEIHLKIEDLEIEN